MICNAPYEYYNTEDFEYANYQMQLHKWICGGKKGPRPETRSACKKDKRAVTATCRYCGGQVTVMAYWAHTAQRRYGGLCCSACSIKRRGDTLKGRKYAK